MSDSREAMRAVVEALPKLLAIINRVGCLHGLNAEERFAQEKGAAALSILHAALEAREEPAVRKLSDGDIEALYMQYCPDDSLTAAISFARAVEQRTAGLRPEVLAFAKLMETKLRKHDADRGQSWKHDTAYSLWDRLEEEMDELYRTIPSTYRPGKTPADVAGEAADVANFAMMIADVVGGLKP